MQRILIVDDDQLMRVVMRQALSDIYEIIETGEPEAAMAIALEQKPDAILMDLSMPGLSGFELCHAFSSFPVTQRIPIVIVSGEGETDKVFCLKLGASSHFTKPVDLEKLKAGLAQVLNAKKDERRSHVRVLLKVSLILKGKNKDGTGLALKAITQNMSKGGFLCTCHFPLEEGTTVEVTLRGERDLILGHARLVRIIISATSEPQYGFQFIGTTEAADLISQLKAAQQ